MIKNAQSNMQAWTSQIVVEGLLTFPVWQFCMYMSVNIWTNSYETLVKLRTVTMPFAMHTSDKSKMHSTCQAAQVASCCCELMSWQQVPTVSGYVTVTVVLLRLNVSTCFIHVLHFSPQVAPSRHAAEVVRVSKEGVPGLHCSTSRGSHVLPAVHGILTIRKYQDFRMWDTCGYLWIHTWHAKKGATASMMCYDVL